MIGEQKNGNYEKSFYSSSRSLIIGIRVESFDGRRVAHSLRKGVRPVLKNRVNFGRVLAIALVVAFLAMCAVVAAQFSAYSSAI